MRNDTRRFITSVIVFFTYFTWFYFGFFPSCLQIFSWWIARPILCTMTTCPSLRSSRRPSAKATSREDGTKPKTRGKTVSSSERTGQYHGLLLHGEVWTVSLGITPACPGSTYSILSTCYIRYKTHKNLGLGGAVYRNTYSIYPI